MTDVAAILSEALADDAESLDLTNVLQSSAVGAIAAVVNYIITDAFGLEVEESFWVGYHLSRILAPLDTLLPIAVTGAVKLEMQTGEYTNRMMRRDEGVTPGGDVDAPREADVQYATTAEWVESLSNIILGSYPDLRPMLRSTIIGSLHGLLTELGVADDVNPKANKKARGSLYLPTAVRYLMQK